MLPIGKKKLIKAIQAGEAETLKQALQTSVSLSTRDSQGNTFLHLTVVAHKNAIVMTNHLLETHQVNIHARNYKRQTPLHLAVEQNNLALIRLLLSYDANCHAEDEQGQSSLNLAIQNQQAAMVELFMAASTVDLYTEQLQLRNNILSILKPPNTLIETLNCLSRWYKTLPITQHPMLKELETLLQEPQLLVQQSTQSKKKTSSKMLMRWTDRIIAVRDHFQEQPLPQRESILLQINNVLSYYDLYKESLMQDIVEAKREHPIDLRLHSATFGHHHLASAAAKRFVEFFNPGSPVNSCVYERISRGSHSVIQMNQTHYKIKPTAPGIEQAVHAISTLITGAAVAPTELLVLKEQILSDGTIDENELPVLASKTVDGVLLCDLLEQQPSATQQFDPYNYSLQFILALLTVPADGKPDNFIAKANHDGKGRLVNYEIIGIDNDESFADPIFRISKKCHTQILWAPDTNIAEVTVKTHSSYRLVRSRNKWRLYYFNDKLRRAEVPIFPVLAEYLNTIKIAEDIQSHHLPSFEKDITKIIETYHKSKPEFGEHYLLFKTIIFCLPQIDKPINVVLRKQLLEKHPAFFVIQWLKLLNLYNQPYESKEKRLPYQPQTLKAVGLPLRLVPGTASKLYRMLSLIQEKLRENPTLSHKQLLTECYPLVSYYYTYICRKNLNNDSTINPDIYTALDEGPAFETLLLSARQKEELATYTRSSSAYCYERSQTMLEECTHFFEQLDFSTIEKAEQEDILRQLIANFPEIESLTLNNCTVLQGTILNESAIRLTNLNHLTLNHCQPINNQGIHALINRFPQLRFTLAGNHTLAPHELLSIIQYCPQFYLVLPDGTTHHVHHHTDLLPKAIQQNDISLVTFLLLAGRHLNKENHPTSPRHDYQPYSPLHDAIAQKNVDLVRQLIHYRANVNQYIEHQSPLDKAYELLYHKRLHSDKPSMQTIIGLLLEAGALECNREHCQEILTIGVDILDAFSSDVTTLKHHLVQFALSHNQLTPQLIVHLIPKTTTELNWQSTHYTGHKLNAPLLQTVFTHIPALETLNLSGCEGLDRQHIRQCRRQQIKTLILNLEQAIQTGMLKEKTSSPSSRQTMKISINAANLCAKAVVERFPLLICALTNPANQITSLEITNATLTAEQFQQLAVGLTQSHSLKNLVLSGIGLGRNLSCMSEIIEALKNHPLITSCKLENNHIDEEGAKIIEELLHQHPPLIQLGLTNNPLQDAGVNHLKSVIAKHLSLQKLILNQVGLTDAGFMNCVDAIIKNPNLNFLDIGYNELTEKSAQGVLEIARLKQTITDLRYEQKADDYDDLTQSMRVQCPLIQSISIQCQQLLEKNQQQQQQVALLQHYKHALIQRELTQPFQPIPKLKPKNESPPLLQKKASVFGMLRSHSQKVASKKYTVDRELDVTVNLLAAMEEELESTDAIMREPLAYYQQCKTQLNREISDNEREKYALINDVAQLKNRIQGSRKQVSASEVQLARLTHQHEALCQRQHRIEIQLMSLKNFQDNKQLCYYYHTLHLKLENILLILRALSHNVLQANADNLLAENGESDLGIELLGERLAYIPTVGTWCFMDSSLPEKIQDEQKLNQAKHLRHHPRTPKSSTFSEDNTHAAIENSIKDLPRLDASLKDCENEGIPKAKHIINLGSPILLMKIAEQTARTLTENYQQHIMVLNPRGCTPDLSRKGKQPLKTGNDIEHFADVAVLKIFETLLNQTIKSYEFEDIVRHLLEAVVTKQRTDYLGRSPRIEKALKPPIKTAHGELWLLERIYTQPGLITPKGVCYAHKKSEPSLYGYRKGTRQEASHLDMRKQKSALPSTLPLPMHNKDLQTGKTKPSSKKTTSVLLSLGTHPDTLFVSHTPGSESSTTDSPTMQSSSEIDLAIKPSQ